MVLASARLTMRLSALGGWGTWVSTCTNGWVGEWVGACHTQEEKSFSGAKVRLPRIQTRTGATGSLPWATALLLGAAVAGDSIT